MHPTAYSRSLGSAGLRRSVFVVALTALVIGFARRPAPAPSAVSERPASAATRFTQPSARPDEAPPNARKSDSPASLPPEITAALALPSGEKRDTAFTAALERWILNDPAAASVWIARLTDTRDFDRAAALLVIRTDALHRTTATALAWAEDLADPALRRRALVHVLREWAQQDPDAALRYAETAPALADHRSAVLAALLPPVPET